MEIEEKGPITKYGLMSKRKLYIGVYMTAYDPAYRPIRRHCGVVYNEDKAKLMDSIGSMRGISDVKIYTIDIED